MYYYENDLVFEEKDLIEFELFDVCISYINDLCSVGDSCFCGQKAQYCLMINNQQIKLCADHKEKLEELLFNALYEK